MVDLCRRLTIEFMHYVIESRGLRKGVQRITMVQNGLNLGHQILHLLMSLGVSE